MKKKSLVIIDAFKLIIRILTSVTIEKWNLQNSNEKSKDAKAQHVWVKTKIRREEDVAIKHKSRAPIPSHGVLVCVYLSIYLS